MNISASIRKLTNLLIILFVGLSSGLVYWQVVEASAVTSNVHNNRHCLAENSAVRGTIYDRNGVKLAYSVPDPNSLCGAYSRHYADPSLAALIGYYVPGYNPTGLEAQYNNYLNGVVGTSTMNNAIDKILHRAPEGDDLYLTIDERIQQIANQHFDDPPQFIDNNLAYKSTDGSMIVANPHTGEILAIVSKPGYDPNQMVQTLEQGNLSYFNKMRLSNNPNDPLALSPLHERPLDGLYPPGSTFKTVTLLAALESGATTLNHPFDKQQTVGPLFYNGHQIIGDNIPGTETVFPTTTEFGYTHSDNIMFAEIGVATGLNTWLDYARKLFVGQQIPFDLPVAVSNVTPADGHQMDNNELASDAFGQGTDIVTPFQMMIIDNVVANDGVLMRPYLVAKITSHADGTPVQTYGPQSLGTIVSSQTATQVRRAMFGVIHCGSGSYVDGELTNQLGVIGKTGTAEVQDKTGKDFPPDGWLITQAPYSVNNPAQMPALTIVGMKEHGGEGGFVTAPAVAHTYSDIFNKGYVSAQIPPPPVSANYCTTEGLAVR